MPRCEGCGEWVDTDERFCPHCSVKISREAGADRWDAIDDTDPERDLDQEETRRRVRARERERSGGGEPVPQNREPAFEFVLRHPLRRGRRPLLVSAVLFLGSVLVVPALLLAGYSYRLGRTVVFEERQPPEYDDPGKLIIDGTRLVIVSSLPTLLWGLATMLVLGAALVVVPAAEGLGSFVVLVSAAGLLWFAGTYIVAFVGNDSVVEAFTDGRARVLRTAGIFLKGWLLMLVFAVVVLVGLTVAVSPLYLSLAVGAPLPVVLVVSPVALAGVGLVVGYAVLVGATYAGYVYYEAADRGVVSPPEENEGMAPGSTGLADAN